MTQKKGTREKLLECAAMLFTEKGYDHTSISDICDMADANIASINYHFRSKDALYREVLQFTFDQAMSRYPADINDNDPPEKKLYKFILAIMRRILSDRMRGNFYKLLAKEMADPTEASGDIIHRLITPQKETMQKMISEIHGHPADQEQIFRLTYSVMSQCLFLSYNEKGRARHLRREPFSLEDAEPLAAHICNFSLAGLKCYQEKRDI